MSKISATIAIPSDFPNPHRLGGASLFRALLGGTAESTFARWLAEGSIAAPVKLGGCNAWAETYMAQVVANGTQRVSKNANGGVA